MIIIGYFFKGPAYHKDVSGLMQRRMIFESRGIWEKADNFGLTYTRDGDGLAEGCCTLYKRFDEKEEAEAAFQKILEGLAAGRTVVDLDEGVEPDFE